MRRWTLALFVLWACASAHRQSAAPPTMAPATQTMPAGDPRSQIEQLSHQIDQEREAMASPPSAHSMAMSTAPVAPAMPQEPTCKPPPTETCTDSCTLSGSICGNAKKICDLAKDMAGDAWAEGKCSDANKACSDAHAKCCSCQ